MHRRPQAEIAQVRHRQARRRHLRRRLTKLFRELPMDMPRNDVRPVELEMFSTPKHLEHASEQARARNYQDFLIVDVESHHYENEHYSEVFEYVESPVIRSELKEGAGGRTHRAKFRGKEKAKPGRHSDITLTLDWMDAMGVDYCCMFPTPMLFLGLHPQIAIEEAMR